MSGHVSCMSAWFPPGEVPKGHEVRKATTAFADDAPHRTADVISVSAPEAHEAMRSARRYARASVALMAALVLIALAQACLLWWIAEESRKTTEVLALKLR